MSLGPCGDYVGFTSKGVLTLAVVQVPFMLSTIFSRPSVMVDIFSSKVALVLDPRTNSSAVDLNHPTDLHYMHSISISAVFMLCSAVIAFFALATFQIAQQGVEHVSQVSHEEFVSSNTSLVNDPTITLWNNTFIAFVIVSHEVVTAVVCTPNSMHFLLMMALVFYTAFSVILQPKIQPPADVPLSSVASTYIVAVGVYLVGMVYVCSNISFDPLQFRLQIITVLLCIDFLLIVGHTWDPAPLMATIINCRFVYLVGMIAFNAAIYVMWERWLKIPYVRIPF
jgi:hypothetical protein